MGRASPLSAWLVISVSSTSSLYFDAKTLIEMKFLPPSSSFAACFELLVLNVLVLRIGAGFMNILVLLLGSDVVISRCPSANETCLPIESYFFNWSSLSVVAECKVGFMMLPFAFGEWKHSRSKNLGDFLDLSSEFCYWTWFELSASYDPESSSCSFSAISWFTYRIEALRYSAGNEWLNFLIVSLRSIEDLGDVLTEWMQSLIYTFSEITFTEKRCL